MCSSGAGPLHTHTHIHTQICDFMVEAILNPCPCSQLLKSSGRIHIQYIVHSYNIRRKFIIKEKKCNFSPGEKAKL